ncbi:MAG TPA: MFS transporter [Cellulomonas sp.]
MGGTTAVARSSRTPWIVWSAALVAYVAAVVHRSSFGVAGLTAADRFGVDATVLSLFVVIQLGTYAVMQLPVGVGVDRWGPRLMLTVGSVTMAVGQLVMTFAPNVGVALAARVLIGSGDAAIFVSAVRLVATWFDRRRVPLLTQLTGIVGQLGQIVTAVPFAFVLHRYGWTPAFGGLVVLGAVASLVVRAGVRDTPDGRAPVAGPSRFAGLADTVRHPGTWLGFWTHMIGGMSGNVVVLMWGFPFLVQGQGLSPARAGGLLTINVAVSVVAGPVIGEFTARHPVRRSWAVLAVAIGTTAGWLLVLLPTTPRPLWQLALFIALISVGGPTSLIGLDFAATSNPPHRTGSAQGIANMGGFVSAVLVMLAVGIVLDHRAPGGSPSLADYRAALAVVFVPLAVALGGVLVTRARTRTASGLVVPPVGEAWARYRTGRRR